MSYGLKILGIYLSGAEQTCNGLGNTRDIFSGIEKKYGYKTTGLI